MYESYFGFKDTPFRLSADEKFRYAHKNYLRASAYLAYALQQSEGFVMITGQPGSGKTTLVRDVISEIDATRFNAMNLVTSQLQAEELLRKVALEYGLPAESYNKATLLTCINKHLSALHEQGKRSILFLDEAQNLSLNGLEELRLLSNLQTGNSSLLQIVLIGHDELRELVLGPKMEHIQQRLIATCQIKPMSDEQTREYIKHRLSVVGWHDDPRIDENVFLLIHKAAQGVPRKINHLMSRILLFASLEEKHELIDEDALEIIEELVEEQRISLPENESFEDFVHEYKLEKVEQAEAQQVTYQKAAVHDIFENKPLQEQFFDEAEIDKRKEDIANTSFITENLLSAIDATDQDFEEAWDLPDSDWSDWDSDLTVIKRMLPSVDKEEHETESDDKRFSKNDDVDLFPEDEALNHALPSADDIWNNKLESIDMDSLISGNQKQKKPSVTETKRIHADNKLPSIENEHRWGGVWWMSSENQNGSHIDDSNIDSFGDRGKHQSSRRAKKTNNTIVVEENLSMPSMWVEGCPEVVEPETAHLRNLNSNPKLFRSSIFHVVAWVGIGLLIMMTYAFYSNQINGYFNVFADRIDSIVVGNPQLTISKKPDDLLSPGADLPAETEVKSLIEDNESVEQSNTVADDQSWGETLLRSDFSDIDTIKNIELATRYAVFFDFNKSAIPTKYITLLKSVQYKMLTKEDTFLRIIGYADTQGDSGYNYRLSLKRADEVKQFLTKRGLSGERLHVTAIGAADEEEQGVLTRDESAKRRRVELILFPN
ncbi:MAG: AAA family ATPase [Candidatus Thiodiazotropha sp. LLP2]